MTGHEIADVKICQVSSEYLMSMQLAAQKLRGRDNKVYEIHFEIFFRMFESRFGRANKPILRNNRVALVAEL